MANKVDAFKVVVTDSNAPSQRLSSKGGGGLLSVTIEFTMFQNGGGGMA